MTWTAADAEVRRQLEIEWAELVRRGIVSWWPDDDGGGAPCLPVIAERCRADDDQTWRTVVLAAQAGHHEAAMIAMHVLLPGLAGLARRDRRAGLGDYVGAVWVRLHAHPVVRRGRKVRTNLLLDSLKLVSRERDDRLVVLPPWWFDEANPWVQGGDLDVGLPAVSALIDAAETTGVIELTAASMLRSVYQFGLSGGEAAKVHGQSVHMVRYRCSRAVRQMRAARDDLVEAA